MPADQVRGLLDTNIVILRRGINPDHLPDAMAISAITLAELSAGPHEARRNDEQDDYDEHIERARRLDVLQRAENEFDPLHRRSCPGLRQGLRGGRQYGTQTASPHR